MEITALGRPLGSSSTRSCPGECITVMVNRNNGSRLGWPWRMVVDLGDGSDGLGQRAAATDPDVVVLTHDDTDHIGGAAAALATMSKRGLGHPREIWMPADWLYLLTTWATATFLANPPAAADELDERLVHDVVDGDTYAQVALPDLHSFAAHHSYDDRLDDIHSANQQLDEILNAVVDEDTPKDLLAGVVREIQAHRQTTGDPTRGTFSGSAHKVGRRVIQRAQTLVSIVAAARTAGLVRWFSVDTSMHGASPYTTEGIPGAVTLLNAREVRRLPRFATPRPAAALFALARLTVSNQRALVTYIWPEDQAVASARGGAIVWSDSDGAGCDVSSRPSTRTPWQSVSVMTAPHHGSTVRAHTPIWAARTAAGSGRIGVLLSNNRHATTSSYTALPTGLRACTRCPSAPKVRASLRDAVAVSCGLGWHYAEV